MTRKERCFRIERCIDPLAHARRLTAVLLYAGIQGRLSRKISFWETMIYVKNL